MASSFETHRFAMLPEDAVSDPHGEERVRASRTMRPREKRQWFEWTEKRFGFPSEISFRCSRRMWSPPSICFF